MTDVAGWLSEEGEEWKAISGKKTFASETLKFDECVIRLGICEWEIANWLRHLSSRVIGD